MTVETANLWPVDFGEPALLTPLAILRQQATALGAVTNNIVVGRVATRSQGEGFVHHFSLYCSPLAYEANFLLVRHGIDLYPANVQIFNDANGRTANDPDQLRAILKEMFANERTKKIIASLLAQSRQ